MYLDSWDLGFGRVFGVWGGFGVRGGFEEDANPLPQPTINQVPTSSKSSRYSRERPARQASKAFSDYRQHSHSMLQHQLAQKGEEIRILQRHARTPPKPVRLLHRAAMPTMAITLKTTLGNDSLKELCAIGSTARTHWHGHTQILGWQCALLEPAPVNKLN